MKDKGFKTEYLYTAVMVLPFLGGLSRLFLLYFSAAVLCVALIIVVRQNGGLVIPKGPEAVLSLVIFASAVVSFLTAIDRGDAFYGLMRIVAAGLFVLLLYQLETIGDFLTARMPDFSVLMIAICAAAYVIPATRQLFFSGGRLGGFFQYANTMALYILISLIVLLMTGEKNKPFYFKMAVLIIGLLWTGSRTTLALFVLFMVWFGIKNKRYKFTAGIIASLAAATAAAYFFLGKFSSFARIFTMGSYNSTFWGRLLYWEDALPVILAHPFGLGYGGYMRIQPAIQTGVYVTRYIHNDYLQIALDHGVVAMVAFIVLLVSAVIRAIKNKDELRTVLLIIFAIHIGWDFDLQYYAMTAFLLLLITQNRSQGRHMSRKALVFVFLSCIYIWLGSAQAIMSAGDFKTSFLLYPWDSVCEEQLMYYSQSEEEMGYHIDHILSTDPYSSSAWRMQAFRASSFGDYDVMIDSIDKYLSLRKYDMEAHSDMIVLLDETAKRIENEGDGQNAALLSEHINVVLDQIEATRQSTSKLAYKLRDKPDFTLSDEANVIVAK